jgi:hypothetical protein
MSLIGSYKDFPREKATLSALSTTPQNVGTASRDVYVSGFIITGGAASNGVIFRSTDNSGSFIVQVPAGVVVTSPCGFFQAAGLEVLTVAPAGDIAVTVFYTQNP